MTPAAAMPAAGAAAASAAASGVNTAAPPRPLAPSADDLRRSTNRDMAQRVRFGGLFYVVAIVGVVALSPALRAQTAAWAAFGAAFGILAALRFAVCARAELDGDPAPVEFAISALYLASALAWCAFLAWTFASIRQLDGAVAVAVIATVGITSGGIASAVPRLRLLITYALLTCPAGLATLPLFVPGSASWVLLAFALAFFAFSIHSGLLQHRAHWAALRQNLLLEQQAADLDHARREAEFASSAKSAFLTSMSHELRTPMNAILGFSELLLASLPPRERALAGNIHHAGRHLLALIDDLLDLGRVETGHLMIERVPVRVDGVLREALGFVEPLLRARAIEVVDALPADLCVLADPTRLRQVLVNLLSNAAKYNHEQGRVVVESRPADQGGVRLCVSDTGPGIAPEHIGRLFKVFERLGAEHSGVDGMGVGLALSHQIAALMGGRLGVESELGRGSTFWIELPRAAAPPAAQASGFEVIYIAHDRRNRELVERLFAARPGWRLRTEDSAVGACASAARAAPQALMLDTQGALTAALLRALHEDAATGSTPVIVLAADAAAPGDDERGALHLPADLRRLAQKLAALARNETVTPEPHAQAG